MASTAFQAPPSVVDTVHWLFTASMPQNLHLSLRDISMWLMGFVLVVCSPCCPLQDEALDEFLAELDGSNFLHEGEAQAYFEHAMTLRDTVRFLRWNQDLEIGDAPSTGLGLDLIRCESINSLDAATCARVLQKNYTALISMSPLARETRSLIRYTHQHHPPLPPPPHTTTHHHTPPHTTTTATLPLFSSGAVRLRG